MYFTGLSGLSLQLPWESVSCLKTIGTIAVTTKQAVLTVMCALPVSAVVMAHICWKQSSDLLFPDSVPSLKQPETEETDATAYDTKQPEPTLPHQTE